jgi:type II secretory pathway pseudopilin PulG
MTPFRKFRRIASSTPQGGYILLTLMLFVALIAIAATAVAPSISFRIRRDREEEMIHRGVQYSRAVRRYFKKFGRFPNRIEELESANNMRFLRKRYKDPITGQDFQVLHLGDVKLSFGPGIVGASAPGAGLGGAGSQNAALASAAAATLVNSQTNTNLNPPSGDKSSNSGDSNSAGSSSGNASSFGTPSGQVFGGGPIVGVVSTSQAQSIREFNKKNHYNDWQFIYDPGTDRGGLLNTPAQPPLQNAVPSGLPGPGGAGGSVGPGGAPGVPLPPQNLPQPPPQQ